MIRREAVTFSDADDGDTGPSDLTGLSPGTYRFEITCAGDTKERVRVDFEVLRCVDAVGGCHTLTFTIPPGIPRCSSSTGPATTTATTTRATPPR